MRRTAAVPAVVCLLVLGACGRSSPVTSGTTPSPTASPATPTAGPTVTATSPAAPTTPTGTPKTPVATKSATPTTPASSPTIQDGLRTVRSADDGTTVTLTVGQPLRVVLDSTYWQFEPVANPSVIRVQGKPATSPSPGCVPGAGCGTASADFVAVGPGQTDIVATRSSCGEAMGCTGNAGRFHVAVVVAATR